MKLAKWPLKAVSMMAVFFAFIGANTACWWIVHEPKKPQELRKLQKIK